MRYPVLSAVVTLLLSISAIAAPVAAPATSYGKLPMSFEENRGQMDPSVKFLTRNGGAILSLLPAKVVVTLPEPARTVDPEAVRAARHQQAERSKLRHTVALRFAGANPAAVMEGINPLIGKVNYLLGLDPARWRVGIPTYAAVRSRDVYPGIDVVYYGNEQQFEYDFVVAPGVDPDAIRLSVEGAHRVSIDQAGDLILQVGDRVVRQKKPLAYQELNGVRQVVAARFVKRGREIRFRIGDYDRRSPLVIDPVLELLYSTYFGGANGERGLAIAVDTSGCAYIAGTTSSSGLATPGAFNTNQFQGYVTKMFADGTDRFYTTYYDGAPSAIAVDASGNAYIAGISDSMVTVNAAQPVFGGGPFDTFVAKLSADGSQLLYATFLGGPQYESADAIDVVGDIAYITGRAVDGFPLVNPLQLFAGAEDAIFAKIDTAAVGASSLLVSTYLGGPGAEQGRGIDVDSNGKAHITGYAEAGFPTNVEPCFALDAFAVRIATAPLPVVVEMATCLSGGVPFAATQGYDIAVGPAGSIFVTGQANANFTLNPVPADPSTIPDGTNAFVTRLNADGSVVYSRFVGGNFDDFGTGIAVDVNGSAYITGRTNSADFPVPDAFQSVYGGFNNDDNHDAFVTKIDPAGFTIYASFFGGVGDDDGEGIAVDLAKNVYFVGTTGSMGLSTPGAYQTTLAGSRDAFVVKLAEINTPVGQNIVKPKDTMNGQSPVSIEFGNVTQAGVTGLTTSASGPNPPAGFQLGNPPTYYELSTTAVFVPPAVVCIDYTNISFGSESTLQLFHYENNAWVNVTTSQDTVANIICGIVNSFSPFAVFESNVTDASGPVIVPTVSPAPNGAGWNNGPVTVTWDVTDPESGIVSSNGCTTQTLSNDTAGTTITCSAENGAGLTASVSVVVKIDTIAPALACAASPNTLQPPNHKLVEVVVAVNVTETGSGAGAATLTSVTSNEPDNGGGDGDTVNDVQGFVVGTADFTGLLRAERSGSGNGRVYSLSYAATDIAGNTGVCTTTVSVPHGKGK